MSWFIRLGIAALVLRALGGERIAGVIRWLDQRLELFSPRGAGVYAAIAPRLLAPLHRLVAKEVAVQPGRVLDVGTGPGALAVEIARRCSACRVVGIDLAPDMLRSAARRASDARVADRVDFMVADAGQLPLADASVDVAVSTLSLHHWRDPAAVLRELWRVVRPGGRVLIYDIRFSYSPRQMAGFVDASPFAADTFDYRPIRAGRLPVALYARYFLRRS